MKYFIIAALPLAMFFVGCDDSSSSSSENPENEMASSSSVVLDSRTSSDSVILDSRTSSSVNSVEESSNSENNEKASDMGSSSSSSIRSPFSYAESKVMPSGTYDCSQYKCVTTENLNQELLEAGKYGEIIDARDSQVYKTIQIGEQIWMAQNLNYHYTNFWSDGELDTLSACFDDKESYCEKFGSLYQWAVALDIDGVFSSSMTMYDWWGNCITGSDCSPIYPVQGLCPSGWHLPDTTEFQTLFAAVGGAETAAKKLKSTKCWEVVEPAANEFGFSLRSTGYYCWSSSAPHGDYHNECSQTLLWTSSPTVRMTFYHSYDHAVIDTYRDKSYISIRCLKN
jgi:uncharacterized protein (TIGR02145 family)